MSMRFFPAYGPRNKISIFRPFSYGIGKRLKENKFDALWIHGYNNQNFIRAILKANNQNIKVLFRGESNLKTGTKHPFKFFIKQLFLKWFFQRCDAFLAIGSLNKAFYLHFGVSKEKIFDMPYSVDNSYFQNLSRKFGKNRDSFRSSLGLAPNRPVIPLCQQIYD